MTLETRWQGAITYLGECLRLLYWIYFKPFTLHRWLRTIHPGLEPDTNSFSQQAEFSTNPALARYASQVWWLMVFIPILVTLLVGMGYPFGFSLPEEIEQFKWQYATPFLLGWSVGLFLISTFIRKTRIRFLFLKTTTSSSSFRHPSWSDVLYQLPQLIPAILLVFLVFAATWSLRYLAPETFDGFMQPSSSPSLSFISGVTYSVAGGVPLGVAGGVPLGVALGVTFGVTFGVTGGVPLGVAGGVVLGVAGGVVLGVALGVAGGVVLGVVFGVAFSVTFSIAGGIAGGVALGVAGGVAGGVAIVLGVLRVWFWLPELLWMVLLGLVVPEAQAAKGLRWLPPRFDELIYLPLPFMAEFIAQAHRTNPVAAQQTIDYLVTSTNQQRVAAVAMAAIAVDRLAGCQTVEQMGAMAGELAWIPSPPPPQVGPLLPQFLDLSQGVRAATEMTSTYRQWEALGPVIQQVQRLKQELAQQSPALATTYGGIVEQWLGLLTSAQTTLQAQALRSSEIPAVYVAGAALDPATAGLRFRGRQDLFREIETLATASQPPTLLLYGGRRTGKTSALKYLPQRVGPDLVPLLVDVQGMGMTVTLQGTAQFLVSAIQQAARQGRNLTLPAPDLEALATDPFAALQHWFTTIEQTCRGKRFLLCLDEFDRFSEVVNATGSRAPLNFLRYIIQHQQQWIVLFSGSRARHELEAYWSDYLINAQSLKLSYLEASEARALVQTPIEGFPDIYTPAAVEAILHLTHCQPYYLQLTCLVLVEDLNRRQARERGYRATPEDVAAILPKVIERGGEVLRERFTTLPPEEQALLLHLVTQSTLPPDSQATLQRLIQRDILELAPQGVPQFQVPLFRHYVEGVAAGRY